MIYRKITLHLGGTSDIRVSEALYQIAGFSEGSRLSRTRPSRHENDGGSRSILGIRSDSFRAPDDIPSPDFIVTALLNDKYIIEFNEKIHPAYIEALKARLSAADS